MFFHCLLIWVARQQQGSVIAFQARVFAQIKASDTPRWSASSLLLNTLNPLSALLVSAQRF
jgi:hypothetical protein